MRFTPEAGHGANAGLAEARKRLEPIKAKHPNVREQPPATKFVWGARAGIPKT
jgi:hypothetical protein